MGLDGDSPIFHFPQFLPITDRLRRFDSVVEYIRSSYKISRHKHHRTETELFQDRGERTTGLTCIRRQTSAGRPVQAKWPVL